MLSKILESKGSSASVIDYNEEKFWRGEASVVLSCNISDPGPEGVYREILSLEQNPEVSAKVVKKSFHMAVNPAPTDFMGDGDAPPSEELVLSYIQEVMDRLGMGAQPYVVYRHRDIERTHYHVVSTRVQKDGHLVPNHYWRYKLMDINKSLSEKYAFVIGQESDAPEKTAPREALPQKFTPGMANVREAAKRIFEWALSLPFRTMWQFQCLLKSMNIGIRSKKVSTGETVMYLQGLDEAGRIVKGRGLADHVMTTGGLGRIREAMTEHRKTPRVPAVEAPALRTLCEWVGEKSRSWREFSSMMAELGVSASMHRRRDGEKEIDKVLLVVRKSGAMADSDYNELDVNWFRAMEENGKWKRNGRGRPAAWVRSLTREEMAEARILARKAAAQARRRGAGTERQKNLTIK